MVWRRHQRRGGRSWRGGGEQPRQRWSSRDLAGTGGGELSAHRWLFPPHVALVVLVSLREEARKREAPVTQLVQRPHVGAPRARRTETVTDVPHRGMCGSRPRRPFVVDVPLRRRATCRFSGRWEQLVSVLLAPSQPFGAGAARWEGRAPRVMACDQMSHSHLRVLSTDVLAQGTGPAPGPPQAGALTHRMSSSNPRQRWLPGAPPCSGGPSRVSLLLSFLAWFLGTERAR